MKSSFENERASVFAEALFLLTCKAVTSWQPLCQITCGCRVRQSYNPLQIILEILRNLGNQMRPVHAIDVMVVAGIDEIV